MGLRVINNFSSHDKKYTCHSFSFFMYLLGFKPHHHQPLPPMQRLTCCLFLAFISNLPALNAALTAYSTNSPSRSKGAHQPPRSLGNPSITVKRPTNDAMGWQDPCMIDALIVHDKDFLQHVTIHDDCFQRMPQLSVASAYTVKRFDDEGLIVAIATNNQAGKHMMYVYTEKGRVPIWEIHMALPQHTEITPACVILQGPTLYVSPKHKYTSTNFIYRIPLHDNDPTPTTYSLSIAVDRLFPGRPDVRVGCIAVGNNTLFFLLTHGKMVQPTWQFCYDGKKPFDKVGLSIEKLFSECLKSFLQAICTVHLAGNFTLVMEGVTADKGGNKPIVLIALYNPLSHDIILRHSEDTLFTRAHQLQCFEDYGLFIAPGSKKMVWINLHPEQPAAVEEIDEITCKHSELRSVIPLRGMPHHYVLLTQHQDAHKASLRLIECRKLPSDDASCTFINNHTVHFDGSDLARPYAQILARKTAGDVHLVLSYPNSLLPVRVYDTHLLRDRATQQACQAYDCTQGIIRIILAHVHGDGHLTEKASCESMLSNLGPVNGKTKEQYQREMFENFFFAGFCSIPAVTSRTTLSDR